MFLKTLIANRGEIAVRIIRSCREMGIKSAAIYSDADITSLHTRFADESYHIGSSQASESYLNKEKIIQLAKEIGADAIHPGMVSFLRMQILYVQSKKIKLHSSVRPQHPLR